MVHEMIALIQMLALSQDEVRAEANSDKVKTEVKFATEHLVDATQQFVVTVIMFKPIPDGKFSSLGSYRGIGNTYYEAGITLIKELLKPVKARYEDDQQRTMLVYKLFPDLEKPALPAPVAEKKDKPLFPVPIR